MSVQNLQQGFEQALKGKKYREKRKAELQQSQALQEIGAGILSSPEGQTTVGTAAGQMIFSGIDPTKNLATLQKVSPEKLAYGISLQALVDPKKRDLADAMMQLYGNVNFEKSFAQNRGRLIAKLKYGSGSGSGSDKKTTDYSINFGILSSKIEDWLKKKEVKTNNRQVPIQLWKGQYATENMLELDSLIQNELKSNYTIFNDSRGQAALLDLAEKIRIDVMNRPFNDLKKVHKGEDEKEIVSWKEYKTDALNKNLYIDYNTGNLDLSKTGTPEIQQTYNVVKNKKDKVKSEIKNVFGGFKNSLKKEKEMKDDFK